MKASVTGAFLPSGFSPPTSAEWAPAARKLATLARDLDKIAGVARYVERIRLARIGGALRRR